MEKKSELRKLLVAAMILSIMLFGFSGCTWEEIGDTM